MTYIGSILIGIFFTSIGLPVISESGINWINFIALVIVILCWIYFYNTFLGKKKKS